MLHRRVGFDNAGPSLLNCVVPGSQGRDRTSVSRSRAARPTARLPEKVKYDTGQPHATHPLDIARYRGQSLVRCVSYHGAGSGNRTHDILLGRRAFYLAELFPLELEARIRTRNLLFTREPLCHFELHQPEIGLLISVSALPIHLTRYSIEDSNP